MRLNGFRCNKKLLHLINDERGVFPLSLFRWEKVAVILLLTMVGTSMISNALEAWGVYDWFSPSTGFIMGILLLLLVKGVGVT